MVAVPLAIAVTKPEFDIVAIAALEDDHGFIKEGVPLPVSCAVVPTQAFRLPLIEGKTFTVNVVVMKQPVLVV